ncbi:MAG: hypothetical protein RR573_00105, partial [Oscillospiraceae bacterium]
MRISDFLKLRLPERKTVNDPADIEDLTFDMEKLDAEAVRQKLIDDNLQRDKVENTAFNAHKIASILDHPDNSVTDAKIGERSIGSTKGLLQPLFTAIANVITAIVGGTEWNSVPDTTLKSAKLHMDSKENPHSISANQIGAYTKSEADVKCKAIQDDVTAHKANTGNPHVTTAEQTGAYTKQQVDNKFAAIPKATASIDGLQTKENVADVNANTANRHNHNNKAVLDVITNVLINTWNTVTEKLNLSGGTLTGFLTLHAAPTANMHAANKKYVDDIAGGKGNGDMLKTVYDANNDGIVDNAALLGGLASGEFCRINDARLSDARPASDVSAWAKATNKPAYTASEIGLGNVNNTADANKNVSYANNAGNSNTLGDGVGAQWSGEPSAINYVAVFGDNSNL